MVILARIRFTNGQIANVWSSCTNFSGQFANTWLADSLMF